MIVTAKSGSVVVFDSGLGGLTVLDVLISAFPSENYVYFADEKFCPYGNRGDGFLINRLKIISNFFATMRPKAVVIACNTASRFRFVFDEIFGESIVFDVINPTVEYVAEVVKAKKVLLLATSSTVNGGVYQSQLKKRNILTTALSCGEFVGFIENGRTGRYDFISCVKETLSQVTLSDYDTVVYGCTHFGFADEVISKFLPKTISVVQCGMPTVRFIKRTGILGDVLNDVNNCKTPTFLTTTYPKAFKNKLPFYGIRFERVYAVDV